MSTGYHGSRLAEDPRRAKTWRALWRHYFAKRIPADGCVLDLGAGYGDFINATVARRRIALDRWPGMAAHLAPGVEPIVAAATDFSGLADDSIDAVLASNLFEHLPQADLVSILSQLRTKLTARGQLFILQPNYRYAYREYFDDYTHVSVYSHISLADLLAAEGWDLVEIHPRFLPLTVKSRLPVWGWLIAAYLASPFKPMGKQMLLVARPAR